MHIGKSISSIIALHALGGLSLLLALLREFPGNTDYADWRFLVEHYAHVVVFAAVFCLVALSAILTAIRHIAQTSHRAMLAPVIAIAVLCGIGFAAIDLSGDKMLLLEFSKSGQVEYGRYAVVSAKVMGQADPNNHSKDQIHQMFSRASVKTRDSLSYSRWFYGLALMYTTTLVAVTFLLLMLLCRMHSSETNSSLFCCLFISTIALLCWFPFRAQFNRNVKSKVFGSESLGGLPFLPSGMGILELAGILLFLIMIGIAVWKFSEEMDKLKKVSIRIGGLIPVAVFGSTLLPGLGAGNWLISIPTSSQTIGVWSLVSILLAAAIPIVLGSPESSAPNVVGEPNAAPNGGPAASVENPNAPGGPPSVS